MPHYADIQVYRRDGTVVPSAYPLEKETCTFGRLENCDIRLQIPQVSKHHCTLQRDSLGYVWLYNHSENGTFVNDQLVNKHKAVCIHSGDTIRILDRMFRLVYKADQLPVAKENHTPPGLQETLGMGLSKKQREEIPFFHTPRTQHQLEPALRAPAEVQPSLNYVDIASKQGIASAEVFAFSSQAEQSTNQVTPGKGPESYQIGSEKPIFATPSRHGQPLARLVQSQSEETPSKRVSLDKTGRGRMTNNSKMPTTPVTLSRTCSFDMASLYMAKLKQRNCQTPMREVATKSKHLRLAKRRASIGGAHELPPRPDSTAPFPKVVSTSHFTVTEIPNRIGSTSNDSAQSRFVSTNEATTNQDSCETTPVRLPTTGTVGMVTPKNPFESTTTMRKVTFGPQLSPEVFDKSAPPATPLIRGRPTSLNKRATPSVKAVSEHPVRVRQLSVQNLGFSSTSKTIPTTPTHREISRLDSAVSNLQTKLTNAAPVSQAKDKVGSLGYRTQPEMPQQTPEDPLFTSIDSNIVREIVDDFYDDPTPDQSSQEGNHQLTPTPLPEDLLTRDTPSLQRVGLGTPLLPLGEKSVDGTTGQASPLDNRAPVNNTTGSICTPSSGPSYVGVRELLKTPKKPNSHHNLLADSSRGLGIRKMLQTPPCAQASDSPLAELKHLWATPKPVTPPTIPDEPTRQDHPSEADTLEASPSKVIVANGAVCDQQVSSADGTAGECGTMELPVSSVQAIASTPSVEKISSPAVTQTTQVLPTDKVSWGVVTPRVLDSWPVPAKDKSHSSAEPGPLSSQASTTTVEHCTPKQSPESTNFSGMAQMLKTPGPSTAQKLHGIKEMFQTPCHRSNTLTSDVPPNPQSSPKPQRTVHLTPGGSNKLVNRTGTQQASGNEDWTGVRQLFRTPAQPPRPWYDLASGSSIRQLLKTPRVDGWSEPLDSSNHSTPVNRQAYGSPLAGHADPKDKTPTAAGKDNTVTEGHGLDAEQRGCSISPMVRVPRSSDRRQTVAWAHCPVGEDVSDVDDSEGSDSNHARGHSALGTRQQKEQPGSTADAVGYSDPGVYGLRRKTLDPSVLPNRPTLALSQESDTGALEYSPDIDGVLSWSDSESISTPIDLPDTATETRITATTDKPDPVSPTPMPDGGRPESDGLAFTPPTHVRTLAMAINRSKGLRTTPGGARRRGIAVDVSVPATAPRSVSQTAHHISLGAFDGHRPDDEVTPTRPRASNTLKRVSTPLAQSTAPTPSHKSDGKSTEFVAASPANRQSGVTPSAKLSREPLGVVLTPQFSPLCQSPQKLVVEVESPRPPSVVSSISAITGQSATPPAEEQPPKTRGRKRSTQPKRTRKAATTVKSSPANQASPIIDKARKESFSLTIVDRTLPTSPVMTRRSTRRSKQRSPAKLTEPETETKSNAVQPLTRRSRRKPPSKETATTDGTPNETPARRTTRRSTRQKSAVVSTEGVESEEPAPTTRTRTTRSARTATKTKAKLTAPESHSQAVVKEQPATQSRKRKSTNSDSLDADEVAPARTLRSRSAASKGATTKRPKRETKTPLESESIVVEPKPSRVTRRGAKTSETDKEEPVSVKPTTRATRSRRTTKRTLATEQDTDTVGTTEEVSQPASKRRRTATTTAARVTHQVSSRKTAASQAPKNEETSKKGPKATQSSTSNSPSAAAEVTTVSLRPRRSTRLRK